MLLLFERMHLVEWKILKNVNVATPEKAILCEFKVCDYGYMLWCSLKKNAYVVLNNIAVISFSLTFYFIKFKDFFLIMYNKRNLDFNGL